MITAIKITKEFDNLEMAMQYYSILSILNGFKWTKLEIQIIAFTSIKDNISHGGAKQTFCSLFGSTIYTLNNYISKLYRGKYLIKDEEDGKTRVNPELHINFTDSLLIQLHIGKV